MINKIGIKIVKDKPENLKRTKQAMEHCALAGLARDKKAFYAQNEDISCPLARYNLGLAEYNDEDLRALARILVGWDDAKTEEIGIKYLKSRQVLPFERKYILYFPMPNNEYEPDVVIEILTPDELMEKVREITYFSGEIGGFFSSGVGAMCGECTAYPILTGKPNLSVGCSGSRPRVKLKTDEMFLALPYGYTAKEYL